MATSYTPVLNLAKPLVNGAETENTWGFDLNANFDKLDEAHVTPEEMAEFLDDVVGQMLEAGDNITIEYKDSSNTFRISATGEVVVTDPGDGQTFFMTRAAATLATLGPEIKTFHTGAFSLHGDKGHGQYVRRATAPYAPWVNMDWPMSSTCQNAGKYYYLTKKPTTASTNSVPPTHTSDTEVIGADQYGWTKISNEEDLQYVRTVDRYTKAGTIDAVHGGWWELILDNNTVRIEQLGGRADFPGWYPEMGAVPTTGTDNCVALLTALQWFQILPAELFVVGNTSDAIAPKIEFGMGRYRFNKTMLMNTVSHIIGRGATNDAFGFGTATQLWFVNTTGSAFCYMGNNLGPTEDSGQLPPNNNTGTANGSILEGVSIHGTWDRVAGASMYFEDRTAAVRARCMIECRHVQVHDWRSNGFHIHGAIGAGATYPMDGNANNWRVLDCYVYSCGGNALIIAGADANTGYSLNFTSHGGDNIVRGCGLIDNSTLGNTHVQPHIAGYGDRGVHRAGKHYQYMLDGDPTTLVPGAPGSQNCWYHVSDGGPHPTVWPEWVPGNLGDYLGRMPIYIFNPYTALVGPYVEVNRIECHTNSRSVIGGTASWTTSSAIFRGVSQIIGFANKPSSPEYIANGSLTHVRVGGGATAAGNDYGAGGGINFLEFARYSDGETQWNWGYQGKDIHFTGPVGNIWDITTPSTDQTFGGNAPRPGRLMLYNLALASPNPPYSKRQVTLGNGAPGAIAGEYVAGEWTFNVDVGFGTAAYVCTVSGVKADGPWSVSASQGRGAVVSTTSGRFYRSEQFGDWTIEPSHTSGVQTYPPDIVPWTYLGNSVPEHRACAIIDAAADDARYVRRNGAWVEIDLPDLNPLETKIAELQARIEALEAV